MERRLRPIAPKPMPPPPLMPMGATASGLLWRARKRGREDHLLLPAAAVSKRERDASSSSASSYPYHRSAPPLLPAAAGAAPMVTTTRGARCCWYMPMPESLLAGVEERLRRLSLVPGSPAAAAASPPWPPAPSSSSSDAAATRVVPVERDLISKLQVPKVIKPRAVRPLWTTICIDSTNIAVGDGGVAYPADTVFVSKKTAREVEIELELPGALPAVVSGKNNRVHMVNDAYKAMVGQPVCPWLESLPGAGASRRINGIVVLDVRAFGAAPPRLPNAGPDAAFPCTARITWDQGGGNAIASLTVPCTVEHLVGRSGDYRCIWRFDSKRLTMIYCIE